MSAPHFHDGVFTEANRTNEASGRSWHIPEEREPTNAPIFLGVIAVLLVGLSLIASVAGRV